MQNLWGTQFSLIILTGVQFFGKNILCMQFVFYSSPLKSLLHLESLANLIIGSWPRAMLSILQKKQYIESAFA